jgi:hypothetical protein
MQGHTFKPKPIRTEIAMSARHIILFMYEKAPELVSMCCNHVTLLLGFCQFYATLRDVPK